MQGRRVPKFVWLTRDFYNAFFGWKTAVTFMYGMVEQGVKVVVPTFMLLFLARRNTSLRVWLVRKTKQKYRHI